jgi:hypothetical protein
VAANGHLALHGGSGFTLGVAGATTPSLYNLQNLTLNGATRVDVIGPIILTVAGGFTVNYATTNGTATRAYNADPQKSVLFNPRCMPAIFFRIAAIWVKSARAVPQV